ncbi:MAG: HaeIII family restriction endonuclease [Thaumarchaeota archaeon]|nr:HaeIII family restriction endonuclease [Nitrososphaerota archaeon]
MATQTQSGKAFEYAIAIALYNKLNNGQQVTLIEDDNFHNALNYYERYEQPKQQDYNKAAIAAIDHITQLEPRLEHPISNEGITISIQSDQMGESGDIRDIITVRSTQNWEIGFSAKNNNDAVKHSRLSDRIDFGKEWLNVPCSNEYMNEVDHIFRELREMIASGRTRGTISLWRNLGDSKLDYYRRVLEAFRKELIRIVESNENMPETLFRYLIGRNDFYKIMRTKKIVTVQGFNLYETLNQPSNTKQPDLRISRLRLPIRIDSSNYEGNNRLLVSFDRGWGLSFRVHNASSKIEPSLKFDVRLVGAPPSLYSNNIILR